MRIDTSGNKQWRADLYDRTADTLGESTKAGAIDAACIHANQDLDAKTAALEYLSDELPPAKLEEVAKLLSTDEVEVSVSVSSTVSASED